MILTYGGHPEDEAGTLIIQSVEGRDEDGNPRVGFTLDFLFADGYHLPIAALDPERVNALMDSLAEFVDEASEAYMKGTAEHAAASIPPIRRIP